LLKLNGRERNILAIWPLPGGFFPVIDVFLLRGFL
jgi:hypothetical protein